MKDSKSIEEKALNYFKAFIEDSKVISQYLTENDKEPCWDGNLYLYSDEKKDKEHLLGRVPVQIKGVEVDKIKTEKWKYKLERVDLEAYLTEPTFYIVCQEQAGSKKRRLFYRELLPNLVRKLLKDIGKQQTRKTLFHPLTENLEEFEDQLKVFMSNSKRMISFARSHPFSMDDAVKAGIREFSFIAPSRFSYGPDLLKYLSTHNTQLYAKVSKELDINVPLFDEPGRFSFFRQNEGDIKVGDRVFFNGYASEVKDGRFIINITDDIRIEMPIDMNESVHPIMTMTSKAKYLKDAIKDAEFALALNDVGVLSVGNLDLQLAIDQMVFPDDLRNKLQKWQDLDSVLEKLHVTKPFDLSSLTLEQSRLIDMLIDTVGNGNSIQIPKQQSTLLVLDISNVKLLLWCSAGENHFCTFGDFFDKSFSVSYETDKGEIVNASPFSYLQIDNMWESIDNIDYDSILQSARDAAGENEHCYEMLNLDVLAMISASDAVVDKDNNRCKKLLEEALKLDEWLIDSDPKPERIPIHIVNKMQILKRERELSRTEIKTLEDMVKDDKISSPIKVAAYLLLDMQVEARSLLESLSGDEKSNLMSFPIWHFYKD